MGKVYKVKVDGETFLVEIEEVGQRPSIKHIEKTKEDKTTSQENKIAEEKTTEIHEEKKALSSVPVDIINGSENTVKEKALGDFITSPLPGKIISVNVKPGQKIKKGDLLLVIEAMKMENEVFASHETAVKEIYVKAGDLVETNQKLIKMER